MTVGPLRPARALRRQQPQMSWRNYPCRDRLGKQTLVRQVDRRAATQRLLAGMRRRTPERLACRPLPAAPNHKQGTYQFGESRCCHRTRCGTPDVVVLPCEVTMTASAEAAPKNPTRGFTLATSGSAGVSGQCPTEISIFDTPSRWVLPARPDPCHSRIRSRRSSNRLIFSAKGSAANSSRSASLLRRIFSQSRSDIRR